MTLTYMDLRESVLGGGVATTKPTLIIVNVLSF